MNSLTYHKLSAHACTSTVADIRHRIRMYIQETAIYWTAFNSTDLPCIFPSEWSDKHALTGILPSSVAVGHIKITLHAVSLRLPQDPSVH